MKREEIATEFMEASNVSVVQSDKDHFIKIAAQVAQMRCETCAKEVIRKDIISPLGVFSNASEDKCHWRGCGGCFNHEPKEKL